MQSQLNYRIAQSYHAELIQAGERARLLAGVDAQRPGREWTAALERVRGRISSARATVTQRASRHIA